MYSYSMMEKILCIDDHICLGLPREEAEWAVSTYILKNKDALLPWLPFMNHFHFEGQKKVFERWRQMPIEKGFERMLYDDAVPIGACGLTVKESKTAEIGYWLGTDARGRGIMTKVVEHLVEIGFTHYAMHRMEIRCADKNIASANVAERAGFIHEATLKEAHELDDGFHDLRVYRLLRKEWEDGQNQRSKKVDG